MVKGTSGEKPADRKIADAQPASAFVFKTIADPFAGRLTYFKVMSGVIRNDAQVTRGRPITQITP